MTYWKIEILPILPKFPIGLPIPMKHIMHITESNGSQSSTKEPPKNLQVGIKNRIPDGICRKRTKNGDSISVHYTGTLFENGKEFDSSIPRGTPFTFTLGGNQVIKGWDQGLHGMCIGEKRKLIIPSDLGYGPRGNPPLIPGDEFVSDAYPMKLVGDVAFEVDCQLVTVKEGADVDIGANPSAEESEEALEEGSVKVNNVIHAFRLQETSFDKKAFQTYLKSYLKKLTEHVKKENPEIDVKEWQGKISTFSKKIFDNFKDYQFYTGESFSQDGMIALLNYREDGITPYITLFKDGLKEEKV
ncbi:9341_t:CDS:10 [Funneliformis mosseae]|uniref:peptidylprolyl isomerase n=1 Tax=Funneliformis mosseae TaxID=27381 RepID=A0A9N9BC88_FUNMO|nr:9341_t:CDS:10 [Funneliformis mosseae]